MTLGPKVINFEELEDALGLDQVMQVIIEEGD